MMTSNSNSLYGTKRARSGASQKGATSSTNLAFTSHLSSLISKELGHSRSPDSSATSTVSRGRLRPHKTKEDLFTTHNKNTSKRAAADLADDSSDVFQQHKTAGDIGRIDEAMLARSKARMQEKARLYAELKKGEHLAESSDEDEEQRRGGYTGRRVESARLSRMRRLDSQSLVDFDRKWAEEERNKARVEAELEPADEDEEQEPLVEYTDEFGRTRMGTKAEAEEAARASAAGEPAGMLHVNTPTEARPARPSKVIHGPTIQVAAFNPDDNIAKQMAELAAKRDRTPTPPPETHYDAEHEIRTRGTGFYAFSKDEETRKKEMEELKTARKETGEERQQGRIKKRKRDEAKEERRRKIEELRSKRRAEQFLSELDSEIKEVKD